MHDFPRKQCESRYCASLKKVQVKAKIDKSTQLNCHAYKARDFSARFCQLFININVSENIGSLSRTLISKDGFHIKSTNALFCL